MAEISFIKNGESLLPLSENDAVLLGRWKNGSVVTGKFSRVRNYQFHKKFFAMLNMAFDYYEPQGGLISKEEKWLITDMCKRIGVMTDCVPIMKKFRLEYSKMIAEARSIKIGSSEKDFNSFREWVMVEAGFYNVYVTPKGHVKKPRSISFANMDDAEFESVYKACFSVCWNSVLSKSFESEAQVENAISALLGYA